MVDDQSRVGVCIDTCHGFAAGYDFTTDEGYKKTWDEFEKIIGFSYLKGMHLNDALKELGSKIDRHASLGKGMLGETAFKKIMEDKRLDNIPMVLETPDDSLWKKEIKWLYDNA